MPNTLAKVAGFAGVAWLSALLAGMGIQQPVITGHAVSHSGSDRGAPCTCSLARLTNEWCWRCNVGYVAGRPIDSPALFETLDPHGHELELDALRCESCLRAVAHDGFCSKCRMGFVNGQAYFTRLTYLLALGVPQEGAGTPCTVCQGSTGWCDTCGHGTVGNVVFASPLTFRLAAAEYQVLKDALLSSKRCEMCPGAMVVHGTCPKCQASYANIGRIPVSHTGTVRLSPTS